METFDVDEVYEMIDRVFAGIEEDDFIPESRREEWISENYKNSGKNI